MLFELPLGTAGEFTLLTGALLFFALCIGHSVADFPLQGSFLAAAKDRHQHPPGIDPQDCGRGRIWIYAMSAHCLVHAGFVWIITGSWAFAIAEFIAHWIIDFLKCEGVTNFDGDQALHLLTKLVFVILVAVGVVALG